MDTLPPVYTMFVSQFCVPCAEFGVAGPEAKYMAEKGVRGGRKVHSRTFGLHLAVKAIRTQLSNRPSDAVALPVGGRGLSRRRRLPGRIRGDEDGEGRIIVAAAAGTLNQLVRTLDLLEGEVWVVRVVEPVEAPVAAVFEGVGHGLALVAARDAAVLLACDSAELGGAAVVDAEPAARHEEVEMVGSEVASGVC